MDALADRAACRVSYSLLVNAFTNARAWLPVFFAIVFSIASIFHWASSLTAEERAKRPMAAPAEVSTNFHVASEGNLLILPVDIGGATYQFVLDTGSALSVLDESFKATLKGPTRRIQIGVPGAAADADLFASPGASLRGLPLIGMSEVLCIDLKRCWSRAGVQFNGILGMDALKEQVVQVDFDSGEVRFLKSVPEDARRSFRLVFDYGVPCLLLQIGELPGIHVVEIDTGRINAGSGEIKSSLFSALLAKGQAKLVGSSWAETLGGAVFHRDARLSEFRLAYSYRPRERSEVVRFGWFTHSGLVFSESSRNALGLGYLARYLVTFDFPRSRLYMSPRKHFKSPEWYPVCGIRIRKRGSEIVVKSVDERSSAAKAGVHVGDVLLSVDGLAVGHLSMANVYRSLACSGKRKLHLRRDGRCLITELQLSTVEAPPVAARISGEFGLSQETLQAISHPPASRGENKAGR